MKILFLSAWHPYPPNNGSKMRIYHLLRGLAQEHEIELIAFVRDAQECNDEAPAALSDLCQRVQTVPWKPFRPQSWRARAAFLNPKPRAVVDTFSQEMARSIRRTLDDGQFNVVIASEIAMAGYASVFSDHPAVFEDIETGVLYEQYAHAKSSRDRLRYGLTWAKHSRYLRRLLRHFRACTVVSETERCLLRRHVLNGHSDQRPDGEEQNSEGQPLKVLVVPNCVDVSQYASVSGDVQPYTLIFSGALTYEPNYEAMVWFLQDVYPIIRAQHPDVSLLITGQPVDRPLPPARNVTLTGFVDDVRPLIAGAAVSIAPIWTGAGTRLKILEAMALHTPVVSTSKGAEGLDVTHNKNILLADTPQAFAQAVLSLLDQESRCHDLAEEAFYLVQQKYDWSRALPPFIRLLELITNGNSDELLPNHYA